MTVYVDPLFNAHPRTEQARRYGTTWSHMTCDGDIEELHQMAEKIGLKRSYFQPHKVNPALHHYDLTPSKRKLAIQFGAVETTVEQNTERIRQGYIKAREKTQSMSQQIATNREEGGKLVRDVWIHKAKTQPNPKPSHLVEWQELDEWNKEVDRYIWDTIAAPYTTAISEMQRELDRLRKDNKRLQNALLDKELAEFVSRPHKADDELHKE